jgi:hypothetical protein
MNVSRRSVVLGLSGGALASGSTDAAELLRPTPQETFGPYFPVRTPRYHDLDLTRVPGRPQSRCISLCITGSLS